METHSQIDRLRLVDIRRRGIPIAEQFAREVFRITGFEVSVVSIVITIYRDDLTEITSLPSVSAPSFPFDMHDAHVVLVDDVFYTGRRLKKDGL